MLPRLRFPHTMQKTTAGAVVFCVVPRETKCLALLSFITDGLLIPLCNIEKSVAIHWLLGIFRVTAAANLLPASATGSGRSRDPRETLSQGCA